MSTTFSAVAKRELGYSVDQVDQFMVLARREFEEGRIGAQGLSAEAVREQSFKLAKGGYDIAAVDGALERLEDALAKRERDAAIAEIGQSAWREQARQSARTVVTRLQRPDGEKFDRGGLLSVGYDRDQVDDFAERIVEYFTRGTPLSPREVRTVVFGRKTRGYVEAQVDAVLDRTIQIMQATS